MKMISRAENKIAEAVEKFRLGRDFFHEKVVMDIGSSTGGFTEFVVKSGARKVIAVEKGTRQMKAPLRFHPRVELHEKTDIFEFVVPEKIDVVVADVSFLSIRRVLEHIKKSEFLRKADFLIMVKPQFEARKEQVNRGVVKNERVRREILSEFESWVKGAGFLIVKKADNETRGKNGNLERFYWLRVEG